MNTENLPVQSLVDLLKSASDSYYNQTPLMTDAEYDALVDQLKALDPNNPFFKTVGAPVTGAWPKVKHKYTMGSQDKVKTHDDFIAWATGKGPLVITDKMDGSTMALTYQNGKLISAVTRGDGTEGEEVTPNVLRMQNVKETIEGFSGVLRGEVMIDISTFNTYFAPAGYKNPRNAANGLARDKSNNDLVPHIKIAYFDVISDCPAQSEMLNTEIAKENFCRNNGLKYVFIRGPYEDHEAVWKQFEARAAIRPTLDHEIDGMVVKMDDLQEQTALGDLNGRPRGQIAIKFEAQSKESVVEDIQWQIGRNGRISPVAILAPTDIGGVTITRCTLNNKDYIKALNITVGAKVLVTRNNDVIPGITQLVKAGNGKTNEPTNCPTCNGTLETDGAYLVCAELNCQGKVIGDLAIWIRATKIKGVGPSVLSNLIDIGVDDAYKFMTAEREKFHDACKSEKNGDKLYEQIKALAIIDLSTLLYGLNIPHVGEINSRRIAKQFATPDAIMKATADDLATVPGVKTTADEIVEAIKGKTAMITNLCTVFAIQTATQAGPLASKSFCITGELSLGRETVHDWIRSKGGEIKTGVSKNLDYLVTNDIGSGSSKNKKAAELGVKIINEDELKKMGNATTFTI